MMGSTKDDRSSLGQLIDPNVKILPGDSYYSCIEDLGLDESWNKKTVLSLGDVKELWKTVKSKPCKNDKKIYLCDLLGGSKLDIPELKIPMRNPELEKRISSLRNKLDEKEYQRMTKNVNLSRSYKAAQEDSLGVQLKQMNSGIIAVVQFVVSLGAAFFFGFSGIQIFTGPLELPVCLLLGIGCAVIVGVAELYFLIVHLDAAEEPTNNKIE